MKSLFCYIFPIEIVKWMWLIKWKDVDFTTVHVYCSVYALQVKNKENHNSIGLKFFLLYLLEFG